MSSRNTAAIVCINKHIVPTCSPAPYIHSLYISSYYDCYNLALLVEAFIGVVVNKEDRLEHGGMKKGDGVAE